MSGNSTGNSPNALTWILGINVGIFIIQCFEVATKSYFLKDIFELSHENLSSGYIWTFATYSFLHSTAFMTSGGFLPWHIIGNMLGVFFIGRALIPVLGNTRFLQLYFASTILGGALWLLASIASGSGGVIGASGAALGLLMMFACLNPNQEIQILLWFVIPVRIKPKNLALIVLGLSIFAFLFLELLGSGNSRTAHSAHLGGMLGGWLFYKYIYSANVDIGLNFPSWLKPRRKNTKSASSRYKYRVDLNLSKPDLKREVDRILDKINSKGFGALSPEEKQTLDEARDILNRR